MIRGKFIALEGGEGTGKSTQAKLLVGALAERGIQAILTREPGGTVGAEAIRKLLLDPPGEGWGHRAEALLFAAARSDHVERLIEPALKAGTWVITDRYLDSSRAYQGGAGGVGDSSILQLHDIGSKGLRPDMTLLIEVSPETVAERLAQRDGADSDAIGGRGAAYHGDVARTFRQISQQDPRTFSLIDGNADIETVHSRILEAISPLLGESD